MNQSKIVFYLLFSISILIINRKDAASQNMQKVDIKSSLQCEICKEKIETALSQKEGVKYAIGDINSQNILIKFDTEKLSIEALQKVITMLGYDADALLADPIAYKNLPECCKKH